MRSSRRMRAPIVVGVVALSALVGCGSSEPSSDAARSTPQKSSSASATGSSRAAFSAALDKILEPYNQANARLNRESAQGDLAKITEATSAFASATENAAKEIEHLEPPV